MAKQVKIMLRNKMTAEGYDQKRLAEATGLTERTISELINGKLKRYPKDAIEKIAEVLGVEDINEIMTLIDSDKE